MLEPIAPNPPTHLAPFPQQATSDAELIRLWLHGRSVHTARAYAADAERLLSALQKPLGALTLGDLQHFADTLQGRPATVRRTLASVKSLLSFGHRLGYLPFNVGAALRVSTGRDALPDRILAEDGMHRMLALETNPRNHALLRLLYATGIRVSELCALRWGHLHGNDDGGGFLTVHGKGDRTRVIRLEPGPWAELLTLRDSASTDAPVFRSRKGGALTASQAFRVVREAARRAGVDGNVSPHWLRHAHASHALDRGAPVSLVQATLGHASVATTGRYLHARPGESSGRYLAV